MKPLWRQMVEGEPALSEWLAAAADGGPKAISRVPRGGWPLLAAALGRAARESGRSLLVLCPGPARFLDDLRPWLSGGSSSHLFAEVQASMLDRPPAHDEAVGRRLEALAAISSPRPTIVVTSRRAMARVTLSPADLAAATLEIRPDSTWNPSLIAERLVEAGYSREALVEGPGQFALRGGILDVFAADQQAPVRLEFVGDQIETIRVFDLQNQRSVMAAPSALLGPGRELLLGPHRGQLAVARLRAGASLEGLRSDVREEWEEELTRLAAGSAFPGIELFSAYIDPSLPCFLDHLPPGALILDFEPQRQMAETGELEQEVLMLAAAESRDGELPAGFVPPLVRLDRLNQLSGHSALSVTASEGGGLNWSSRPPAGPEASLEWLQPEPLVSRPRALAEFIANRSGDCIIFASEQQARLEALLGASELLDAGSGPGPLRDLDLTVDLEPEAGLYRADLDLPEGLTVPSLSLTILSDSEIFGRIRRPALRPSRRASRSAPVVALEFEPGDLVVHVDHGIARFLGMKLIDAPDPELGGSVQREYLELEYADQDKLYVPVESLDRVQKYLGGSEDHPNFQRLGSGEWERARQRARRNVQDVADELLKLYSQREAQAGFAFAPDTPWQAELESAFPFEETPDQLAALAEIKADMESPRPMDRLLCGDVGFGKTELALRAAFKAVMSGRQVAILAPTTVLAQQHFTVFSQRLKNYPVTTEVLSRFRTDEEQARTLAGLKAGAVDIVIGTHRLIQRDVRFKRLGLLVIDEEQRFGVMQKERLKKLRHNLDVLSLSATPIPRTLHMAISGIRDMSVVQTPPEDRQPIKTYVTGDEDELVREVVSREIERGGQVYYVHNRVRTIDKAAQRVARLVPRARIAIGHGQMEEDQLAHAMVDFAAGSYDVLVCTTIIESGLDIPNVNTMIVERADRFGLSQLYQLRGRVGRSGKRAYAYFLFDPKRSLTEAADKRLDVMSGLHELGQGFKIALRDLEIRGAGNLLGTEQHGAIAAVGFEMYLQMLQQAVAKVRLGLTEAEPSDVLSTPEMNLDLPLDHFVPRSYIRDERLRLAAYRQLAAAPTEGDLDLQLRSLRDRYGAAPAQLGNLVYSLRLKLLGERMGLRAVVADGRQIVIRVDPDRVLDVERLRGSFPGRLDVRPNRLLLRRDEGWKEDLHRLLSEMATLYEKPRITSNA